MSGSPEISIREPSASGAQNAAFAVEEHQVGNLDWLLVVPLLLHETGLAGSVRERLILQRALAALVTDRAVEGMVDQEKLENALLRLLGGLRLGVHHHAVADRQRARRNECSPSWAIDLDQTGATHADSLHARVVAEARNVGPGLLGRVDQRLTGINLDIDAVERDRDGVALLSHRRPPHFRHSRRPPPRRPGQESWLRLRRGNTA